MKSPDFSREKSLWSQGFQVVAGVDEAGTGALAGPVVAAALILPPNSRIGLIRDSKLLSARQREEVFCRLEKRGAVFATGLATVEEVDKLNVRAAALLAMRRAVLNLAAVPDALLIDAFRIPDFATPQFPVIHGDQLVKSIAAASVIAKVTRDEIMRELDRQYPDYGFAVHKGYGTLAHHAALEKFGASAVHRRDFIK